MLTAGETLKRGSEVWSELGLARSIQYSKRVEGITCSIRLRAAVGMDECLCVSAPVRAAS